MHPVAEFTLALKGLSRLLRLDAGGLDCFDRSLAGFWRSFRVAILAAPLYAAVIPIHLEQIQASAHWARILFVVVALYLIRWFAFAVIAFEICQRIDRTKEYPGYIAVYNWSSLIRYSAQFLAWLPVMAGFDAVAFSGAVNQIVYFAFLVYLWFLARMAANVSGPIAAGLVFIDFLISRLLSYTLMMLLK